MTPDVIIIGGGLHGCSAALHLALRGRRVLVIEKNTVGRHASGVNGGAVRRLWRHPAEIPLAEASQELWHGIRGLVDDDCGFRVSGILKLAENAGDMAILEERARLVRDLGFDHEEMIGPDEARRLVPTTPNVAGGLIARRDGFADPARTVRAFKTKAESLGVVFREQCRVVGIEQSAGMWRVATEGGRFEAPLVVNCAGAWSDGVADWLGEPVPLEAVGLMMFVTERVARFIEPVVGFASRVLSVKQTEEGTVLVGGGMRTPADRASGTAPVTFAPVAAKGRMVAEVFPHLAHVPVMRCWSGIEGFTPDGLPVIGPSHAAPGVFHAFGFSASGFQLSPGVGAVIADLITEGSTNVSIAPFDIGRFAEGAGVTG
jgi:sarcosine oxidase subunit beta